MAEKVGSGEGSGQEGRGAGTGPPWVTFQNAILLLECFFLYSFRRHESWRVFAARLRIVSPPKRTEPAALTCKAPSLSASKNPCFQSRSPEPRAPKPRPQAPPRPAPLLLRRRLKAPLLRQLGAWPRILTQVCRVYREEHDSDQSMSPRNRPQN